MTTRCSIDPDPGPRPATKPKRRPNPGASYQPITATLVADTHTDSWHTASTIDDRPVRRSRSARRVPAPTRDEPRPRKTPRSGATNSARKACVCRAFHVLPRYPIPGGPRGTTFSSPRWTVAALVGVRLAVAGRLCRLMGSWPLTGRVHAAAVADRRAAAWFDVHAGRTNRCGDFWLGGCTRRSHRGARLVVRRCFTACWPR